MSARIRKAKRRHMIELLTVMLVYMAAVIAVVSLSKIVESVPLLAALAFLPPLALGAACLVMYRNYQRMDERQQRIQANAAALTLIVAIVAASAIGFLKSFGVFSLEDDFLWYTPFLIVIWGLSKWFLGDGC